MSWQAIEKAYYLSRERSAARTCASLASEIFIKRPLPITAILEQDVIGGAPSSGKRLMNNFIARANINHFLDLLKQDDVPSERRSSINKLLIEEEDKLTRDSEQLEFAESETAKYRIHVDRLYGWRGGFADGSADQLRAETVLKTFEVTLQQMERFCVKMRKQVNGNAL